MGSTSRLRALIATVALATVSLVAPTPEPALALPGPAERGFSFLVTPQMDLGLVLAQLEPGDTALLAPGTYDVGDLAPGLRPGTSDLPVSVTALDPKTPPLLTGAVTLASPSYWNISHLRLQATIPGHAAMRIIGGQGWKVSHVEAFGAAATRAYANVAILNSCRDFNKLACRPTGWEFVDSCVHAAGPGTAPQHSKLTDHNLYIAASGTATGLVSRNLFFGAPAGANIKIGRGTPTANKEPGPSGVVVRYNTLAQSRRGLVMVGRVHSSQVRYNLIVGDPKPGATREGTFINASTRPLQPGQKPNVIAENLYRDVPLFRKGSPIHVGRDGHRSTLIFRINKTAPRDPAFTDTTCATYQPRDALAKRYGHVSTFFGAGL